LLERRSASSHGERATFSPPHRGQTTMAEAYGGPDPRAYGRSSWAGRSHMLTPPS
jgi:hypothetical protein